MPTNYERPSFSNKKPPRRAFSGSFLWLLLITLICGCCVFWQPAIIRAAARPPKIPAQTIIKPRVPVQPTPVTRKPPVKPSQALHKKIVQTCTVALTFDDGPNPPYTQQILNILQSRGVPATFFVVGQRVAANPEIVQAEVAAGYPVGNHSWSHPELSKLSEEEVQSELSRTSDILQEVAGYRPTVFRPPYGDYNQTVQNAASEENMELILWDNSPDDWRLPGAKVISERAISAAHNGSVILLHDGGGDRSQTVAALPVIIDGLEARGFRFVSLGQQDGSMVAISGSE